MTPVRMGGCPLLSYHQRGAGSAGAPLRVITAPQTGERPVARPNYAFQKRQKDLEKKAKKEAKRLKKLERKATDDLDGTEASDGTEAPGTPEQDLSS